MSGLKLNWIIGSHNGLIRGLDNTQQQTLFHVIIQCSVTIIITNFELFYYYFTILFQNRQQFNR